MKGLLNTPIGLLHRTKSLTYPGTVPVTLLHARHSAPGGVGFLLGTGRLSCSRGPKYSFSRGRALDASLSHSVFTTNNYITTLKKPFTVLQAHLLCPSIQPAPHRGRYGIAAPRRCLPERVCPMCARERVLDTCDCPDAVTCDQFVAIAQRQSCSGTQLWQSVAIIIRDNH
jgi:hypothetical protein